MDASMDCPAPRSFYWEVLPAYAQLPWRWRLPFGARLHCHRKHWKQCMPSLHWVIAMTCSEVTKESDFGWWFACGGCRILCVGTSALKGPPSLG